MSDKGHYSLSNLRRGAWRFASGKVATAILTMVTFALTARLLGVQQYGAYAVAIAAIELTIGLCTLGLDWVTGRYLPEFRQRADVAQLRGFLKNSFLLQLACLMTAAIVAVLMTDRLAVAVGLGDPRVVQVISVVLVFEGCARAVRDQFLGALLAQGAVQLATLSRSVALLALLVWLWLGGQPDGSNLILVVSAEAAAGAVSLLVGGIALVRIVRFHRPDTGNPADTKWVPPRRRKLYELARNAYISTILVLAAGGPVITLVLRAFAGPEAAAAFGFARGLVDQVRRILPLDLFFSLIRAGLVPRYVATRDFTAFNFQIGLIYTLSVLAAMPIVAVMMGQPALVASVVGGPAFAEAASTLVVWASSLLLLPHRRAVELVAYTVGESGACAAGGLVLASGPILVGMMLLAGAATALALSAAVIADLGFSFTVVVLLRRSGFPYRVAERTLWRLVLILLLSTLTLAAIHVPPSVLNVIALGTAGGLALVLTWGPTFFVRPFTPAARTAIHRVLPWPRFPF